VNTRIADTRTTGIVRTYWNGEPARIRSLHAIADPQDEVRVIAEHGAYNSAVQGSASDYCLSSLAACVQWIQKEKIEDHVKLVLTVHDSLLFEVEEAWLPRVSKKVQEIMTSWFSYDVPLVADFKAGPSWGSMKPYNVTLGEFGEDKK
jgi:DNA polymerase I-like protein with 3'-5' exonuclease and polymerase domains